MSKNKYFENLSKDEKDKLIENIINEILYKIFNFLRGGRTWNTFEETENIRSYPEKYDYYFVKKTKIMKYYLQILNLTILKLLKKKRPHSHITDNY